MANQRVTLKHIAERVGVHPSTVSRVLSPTRRMMVSDDIAARILDVAEELGYRPNPLAYGLKTNRSVSVGIVVPNLSNPVFPRLVEGIESILIETGYTPFLANSNDDEVRAQGIIEAMRDRQVDGLILASAAPDASFLIACKEDRLPLVMILRTWGDPEIPSISFDEQLGTKLIVDHLAELGHREIAFISGPLDFASARDRYFGTRKAMEDAGLPVNENIFAFATTFDEDEGARCCTEILTRRIPFSAIVTANDRLAIGACAVLAREGFTVPADVSVAGYFDIPFSDLVVPALTTVRIPQYEAGAAAARLLIERIERPDGPVTRMRIGPTLVVRNSTAPPPARCPFPVIADRPAISTLENA